MILGQEIPKLAKYRYLGIWVNKGQKYMDKHEQTMRAKGQRDAVIMDHRALWRYNRYEVVRGNWKGI